MRRSGDVCPQRSTSEMADGAVVAVSEMNRWDK